MTSAATDNYAQHIPLLAPQALSSHTPESFLTYVHTLYREPPTTVLREVFPTLSKRDVLSFRFNRKPKYLTHAEVDTLYDECQDLCPHKIGKRYEFWIMLTKKRKIPVHAHPEKKA